MYCLFFYFSNSELDKLLDFVDILNKWFEKYFWIKYYWHEYKNLEDLLDNLDKHEKKQMKFGEFLK